MVIVPFFQIVTISNILKTLSGWPDDREVSGRMRVYFGSIPLTGDEHSSDPVNYTIPSALSQGSHAVIFKISEPIRSAREHLHLRVESFGDAVRFGEAPHAHNRFEPRS